MKIGVLQVAGAHIPHIKYTPPSFILLHGLCLIAKKFQIITMVLVAIFIITYKFYGAVLNTEYRLHFSTKSNIELSHQGWQFWSPRRIWFGVRANKTSTLCGL